MKTRIKWSRPSKKSTIENRVDRLLSENDKRLLDASIAGSVADVILALGQGACINARDTRGDLVFNQTPLMWASKGGHLAVVRSLIERGADINLVDMDIEGCAKVPNWGGQSALHYASYRSDWRNLNLNNPPPPATEVIRVLLDSGANPNIVTGKGFYVLQYLISYHNGDNADIIEQLLLHGSDPDFAYDPNINPHGENLLYSAIAQNNKWLFDVLLKYGANLNYIPPSKHGVPNAVALIDERCIGFVDRKMLEIDIAWDGVTVLMCAVRKMSLRSVDYCLSGPCKTINYWCFSHNAPDAQAWTNQPGHETALDMAIFFKQREIEKLLVAHGAKRYEELTKEEKENNTFEKKPVKGAKK